MAEVTSAVQEKRCGVALCARDCADGALDTAWKFEQLAVHTLLGAGKSIRSGAIHAVAELSTVITVAY